MGRKAHAIYDYFALESEWTKYKLRLGAYTGRAVHVCACARAYQSTHICTIS